MKQGKVWGNTELIFRNENFEVHRIETKKGGYSSKHMHRFKHNTFYIEQGSLIITVWKSDYDLKDDTYISQGEKTNVPPGEYHMFTALQDTIAYEIYFTEPITNDIIRDTCGGVK